MLEEAAIDEMRAQVDRILQSDEFRGSEVLRRLLLYLADKAISGESDSLKEYTVAIDGLGKPTSYDPQRNSTVRIQVGRLRQKLEEYYRRGGRNDEFIVDLPKGRFRLTCERRTAVARDEGNAPQAIDPPAIDSLAETAAEAWSPPAEPISDVLRSARRPRWLEATAGMILGVLLTLGLIFATHRMDRAARPVIDTTWSAEMDALWGPFLRSARPLILSIEDPLFVEISSNPGIYYRDRTINRWADVPSSAAVGKLAEMQGKTSIQPSRYYTAFGEAEATFSIGRLLGSRGQVVSMMRTSQLSWQQLADNNVIFVGVEKLFFEQLQGMPLATELVADLDGIRNTHPEKGEPAEYRDDYTTAPTEQGVIYALVTHVVGPSGRGDVESFTSVRSAGYVGAVQFFTDTGSAREIVKNLKAKNGGTMPRSYQVLLQIRFKDNVPTQTAYVLSRILR